VQIAFFIPIADPAPAGMILLDFSTDGADSDAGFSSFTRQLNLA